jgi:hypothetical protein
VCYDVEKAMLDGNGSVLRYNCRMDSSRLDTDVQKRLVQQWTETGRLLAKLRRAELAAQSPEELRQAGFDLLQLGGMLGPDPRREKTSGMVEMQRLFARAHGRGHA